VRLFIHVSSLAKTKKELQHSLVWGLPGGDSLPEGNNKFVLPFGKGASEGIFQKFPTQPDKMNRMIQLTDEQTFHSDK